MRHPTRCSSRRFASTPRLSPAAAWSSATATSWRSTASTSRCSAGECFGLLGPNGAGKTTTVELFEGLLSPDGGTLEVLGQRWQGRRPGAAGPPRRPAPGDALPREAPGHRARRALPQLLPRRARTGGGAGAGRPRGEAAGVRARALRRPETAPVARLRAGRRPGGAVSRRTDHRARPGLAPSDLGDRRAPEGARPDRPAHHALHGRGGAALRPGRHRRPRQDPGGGRPGGARRLARRRACHRARDRTRDPGGDPRRPAGGRGGTRATARRSASRCARSTAWCRRSSPGSPRRHRGAPAGHPPRDARRPLHRPHRADPGRRIAPRLRGPRRARGSATHEHLARPRAALLAAGPAHPRAVARVPARARGDLLGLSLPGAAGDRPRGGLPQSSARSAAGRARGESARRGAARGARSEPDARAADPHPARGGARARHRTPRARGSRHRAAHLLVRSRRGPTADWRGSRSIRPSSGPPAGPTSSRRRSSR